MAREKIERNISYDRGRKLYYVCMNYGKDPDGTRIKKYETFPTLSQARKALYRFEADKDSNQVVMPRSTTLAQWLEYWMKEVVTPSHAQTTVYAYQKIIDNHLVPALGDIPVQKLRPVNIQQYYSMLLNEKRLSPNTIRRHHDLLAASLHMAVKQEVLFFSPVERVEPPKTVNTETPYYTVEHLKKLYAAVDGHWLELIVKLAGYLGLRREEICGLHWSSVNFEQRTIFIKEARTSAGASIVEKETKNRTSTRTLHMNNELYELLQRELKRQELNRSRFGRRYRESGFVAVDDRGNPYSPNAVSLAFARFIEENGLPKITLHGLRHSFATVASAQGVPLYDIGRALGHSTPATTGRIYTHLVDQTHAATIDRVAEAVK
jgi:integrase